MASLAQLKRQAEAQSMKALGAYQGPRAAEKASMKALEDRREQTRQQFFKGRPDIPASRLDKRQIQSDLYEKFKQEQMKPVAGTRGTLYQSKIPGGPTLADKAQELAFKYGPTPREILGDVKYATASMARGLGEKVMSGQFGLLGIAKGLYDQFTNSAAKAKEALQKGVEKLSDIDLEVLKKKDTGEYKFLSKKPEIQEVENLEKTQMTEFDKANIIRQGIEQLETAPVSSTGTPGFKVMPEDQTSLQDIYMQGTKRYAPISVSGTQPMYAGGLESLLPKPIQNLQQRIGGLGQTPIGTFGLQDVTTGKPSLTYEKDIFGGTLGLQADPLRDQYGFEFSRSFNEGGSVDNKLDDMQKKTNNIYGTGILSAR